MTADTVWCGAPNGIPAAHLMFTCDLEAGHSDRHHAVVDLYDDEFDASHTDSVLTYGEVDVEWEATS